MTVQELIEQLEEIEDKCRLVTIVVDELVSYKPIIDNFGEGNILIIGN